MPLPCPPTSGDYFYLSATNPRTGKTEDDEINAEGFRTTINVTGKHFQVGIWLPKQCAHGPYMLIFYASFWHPGGKNSVVETGLSFSPIKALNFTSTHNDKDPKKDKDNHIISKTVNGEYHLLDVLFIKETGRIQCRLDHHYLIMRDYDSSQPISKVNLVIATGNRRDAFYSDATIKLLNVDGNTNFHTGHAEWMRGHGVTEATRRSVFNGSFAHGMTCALPPVVQTQPHANINPAHGAATQSPLQRAEEAIVGISKLLPPGPTFPSLPNLGIPGSSQF